MTTSTVKLINNINDINKLYMKKQFIKNIISEIQLQLCVVPPATKEYGLFIIPDNPSIFGTCDPTSKGTKWAIPHITIAGFTQNNGNNILQLLKQLNMSFTPKTWNPDVDPTKNKTTVSGKYYNIKSSTLDNLKQFATIFNVENLKGTPNDWHITCNNGANVLIIPQFKTSTLWSIIMVEKEGNKITLLNNTKMQFMDLPLLIPIHPIKHPIKQPIKVLTYNISWEAMSATPDGTQIGVNKTTFVQGQKCGTKGNPSQNKCIANLKKFISEQILKKDLDFIALQEASQPTYVVADIDTNKYEIDIIQKFKCEEIITIWNKHKYQLDDADNKIQTYFQKCGRPLTIYFFKQKLCFINIHPGHDASNNISTFDISVNQGINDAPGNINKQNIKNKLATYNIIIAGDMNTSSPPSTLFGRTFYGKTTQNTCCSDSLNGSVYSSYDHILYTIPGGTRTVYSNTMISDHLPVIAELPLLL